MGHPATSQSSHHLCTGHTSTSFFPNSSPLHCTCSPSGQLPCLTANLLPCLLPHLGGYHSIFLSFNPPSHLRPLIVLLLSWPTQPQHNPVSS